VSENSIKERGRHEGPEVDLPSIMHCFVPTVPLVPLTESNIVLHRFVSSVDDADARCLLVEPVVPIPPFIVDSELSVACSSWSAVDVSVRKVRRLKGRREKESELSTLQNSHENAQSSRRLSLLIADAYQVENTRFESQIDIAEILNFALSMFRFLPSPIPAIP